MGVKQNSFSWIGLKLVLAMFALLMLGLCGFGFLATFELAPGERRLIWQAVYGLGGLGCLSALWRIAMSR